MSSQRTSIGHEDMGAKTIKLLAADSPHLSKIVYAVERATLITVLNDPLGQFWPDAWQGFQIGDCGLIQINLSHQALMGWAQFSGSRFSHH